MWPSLQKFGNAAWVVLERRRPAGALLSGLTRTRFRLARHRRSRRGRRSLRFSSLRRRPPSAIAPEIGEVRVFEELEPLVFQGANDVRVARPRVDLCLDVGQQGAESSRLGFRSQAMQRSHLLLADGLKSLALSSFCPVAVQFLSSPCPVITCSCRL